MQENVKEQASSPEVTRPGPANICTAQAGQVQFRGYTVHMLASLFNKRQRTRHNMTVIRKGKLHLAGETLNSFLLAGIQKWKKGCH